MGGDEQARRRPLRRTVLIGLGTSALGLLPARLRAAGAATPDDSARIARPDTKTAADAPRAVLYEEDPGDRNGKRFTGTVRWRIDTQSTGNNEAPDTMVRAGVAIPERQMTLNWTLRRNQDRSLPATHTIDFMFTLPPDFVHRGIRNVPGLLVKPSDAARGAPLAGLAVKVVTGYFLVGLSAVADEAERNMRLLKEQDWFSIPIVYEDDRRAILSFAKGEPGRRAFSEAFATWDNPGRASPPPPPLLPERHFTK
jgi:hypothetical protein